MTASLRLLSLTLSLLAVGAAAQAHPRHPLRIDVPSRPVAPNSTAPILFSCGTLKDCNAQATAFCTEFEYPKGRITFVDLPKGLRPFPIYSVICFGED